STSKPLAQYSPSAAALQHLAQASSYRRSSDVALAWCAERSKIGRLVGTTTARGFYTKRLGFSTSHANSLKASAKTAYGSIYIPEYDPDDELLADESSNQRSRRLRVAKNKLSQEKFAQSESRRLALQISPDQLDAIDHQLRHLNDTAVPGRHRVRMESIQQAVAGRDCADLAHWCRDRIRDANNHPDAHSTPEKSRASQQSARAKRAVTRPRELPNGMMNFGITTDPTFSARIEAIRAQATRVWKARQADATVAENRTLPQFVHDYFMDTILGPVPYSSEGGINLTGESPTAANNPGETPKTPSQDQTTQAAKTTKQEVSPAASRSDRSRVSAQLVIVGTLDDYLNMGPSSKFQTDTGITLTPREIMQLGISECHLGITDNGRAEILDAGRVRNMSQIQRAFLTAMQLVCSYPGCSEPAANCEGHHIVAFSQGGKTEIDNLALLCPYHHRANDDQRTGNNNKGYITHEGRSHLVGRFDPRTGRTEINESVVAKKAPGRRLMAKDGVMNGDTRTEDSRRAA
ncbi:HNH endonuclease signature motif containing protein, partial [Corynebacterium sp.]|uniref:HNH endonuclease signature motif containing protein n=1 Tax=Corynebacterium sp. TaxID=1720 RepID=UPI0027BA27AA